MMPETPDTAAPSPTPEEPPACRIGRAASGRPLVAYGIQGRCGGRDDGWMLRGFRVPVVLVSPVVPVLVPGGLGWSDVVLG